MPDGETSVRGSDSSLYKHQPVKPSPEAPHVHLTCPDASELGASPAAVEFRFLFGARLVLVVSSDAHVLHLTMSNGQALRGAATDPRLAVGCFEVRKKRHPEIDRLRNSSPSTERSLWQGKKR